VTHPQSLGTDIVSHVSFKLTCHQESRTVWVLVLVLPVVLVLVLVLLWYSTRLQVVLLLVLVLVLVLVRGTESLPMPIARFAAVTCHFN
jgi:hypothetical protein